VSDLNLAEMQTPEFAEAATSAFEASPEELGAASVNAARATVFAPEQLVFKKSTGEAVRVHSYRPTGVVVVVEANGHYFGMTASELSSTSV